MTVHAQERMQKAAAALKNGTTTTAQRILNPGFVERGVEAATRGGQFLALALLFALVPISFMFVKIVNTMLVTFLLRGTDGPEHTSFIVTLVTFAFLVMASWFWFQWVRTAGFGLTNILSTRGK